MAVWQKLNNTYEACQEAEVGKYHSGQRPLLPICHVTMRAHIEVVISENGNILEASIITNPQDAITIVPATEDSASPSGVKPPGHPLSGKLQYLASDFAERGGKLQKGFANNPREPFQTYLKELEKWCVSDFSHPKARAVLKYVSKGTLVKDLYRYGILYLGDDGRFLSKKDTRRAKDANDIFAALTTQEAAAVRWVVEIDDDTDPRTWRDPSLWQSWIDYYLSTTPKEAFCYITGEQAILSGKHPKYIRTSGDNAKLISSDDGKGFTYRGRFKDDKEACPLSLEASQKAHFALIWLIDRQGKVFYEKDETGKMTPALTVVAWEKFGRDVPQPYQEMPDLLDGDLPPDEAETPEAGQRFSNLLARKISGYAANLEDEREICILALNSLSKGRSAIVYYQELEIEQYLKNIETWHSECAWHHIYRREGDRHSDMLKKVAFTGAPAPIHIGEAAFGERATSKTLHQTVRRLLPCIVEGRPLPQDLVEAVVRHASNRRGIYDRDDKERFGDDEYSWEKALSIACSLFRKHTFDVHKYSLNSKKENPMALDPTRTTRDYLYGRLLAVADHLEERVLRDDDEKRPTNAARYMLQFSQRPYRTWRQIHDALTPYILRLDQRATFFKNKMAEITCLFDPDDFKRDNPLTGEYLLGYYCQRQDLRQWKKATTNSEQAGSDGDVED